MSHFCWLLTELDFDGAPKAANCAAATNTTTMVCRYTVVENDSAPNGIAIAANKLTLNGGTITATGSTTINADLDHAAVAIDAGQKVDGIRPTLVLTSLVGDGVVLHQEVRSDGRLPKDKPDEDVQARITTELQSPEEANPWRSIGIPVGGALVVLSLVGALTLAFRARRRV